MGYYTRFTLRMTPDADREKVFAVIKAEGNYYFALREDGEPGKSCKWPDHEEDMVRLSLKFPNIRFTLSGKGEENEDIWEKDFRNGKKQIRKAEILIPAFDEAAWT